MNDKDLKEKLLNRLDELEIECLFNNNVDGIRFINKERNRINNNE